MGGSLQATLQTEGHRTCYGLPAGTFWDCARPAEISERTKSWRRGDDGESGEHRRIRGGDVEEASRG